MRLLGVRAVRVGATKGQGEQRDEKERLLAGYNLRRTFSRLPFTSFGALQEAMTFGASRTGFPLRHDFAGRRSSGGRQFLAGRQGENRPQTGRVRHSLH